MQFTVLCEGQAIGHVDLEAVQGRASASLHPLPDFEPFRPILNRFERALAEGARRLVEARKVDPPSTRPLPDGMMIARRIDPALARGIDLDSLRVAVEPARRLHFELRDNAGVRVATRHVFVRILPNRAGAALVTVTFST